MTNGIKVGDVVQIPQLPPIYGKVIEIDDHPLEYAQLRIAVEGAAGTVEIWKSCRMARKINS